MIKTDIDYTEVSNLIGAIEGMAATVRTSAYTRDMLHHTHSILAHEFDRNADIVAASAPQNFHHVYEWGMTGNPLGRLWKHTIHGAGNSRVAGYQWKASRVPIPTPEERAGNPNDPISQLDSDELARLSDRRYFFYWKAPVMEYNMTVHIVGKYSKRKLLFIPTWEDHKYGDEMKPFVLVKSATIPVPGGQNTSGQFTFLWDAWWLASAPAVFDREVRGVLERDLAESVSTSIRRRRKSVSLSPTSAQAEGYAQARAFLQKKMKQYEREDDYYDE